MAKHGKGRKKPPRRQHLRSVPTVSEASEVGGRAEDQPLMQSLRAALRTGVPADFLGAVSQIVSVTEPTSPLDRRTDAPSLEALVETFVGTDIAETTAALTAIRAFTADELLAARIGQTLATRRQPLPDWLQELGRTEVTTVLELTEELKDGDDYLLGARLPSGDDLTALVYVDHNLGSVVKDAFVIGDSIESVAARMSELVEQGQTLGRYDPGTARAVITRAIEDGSRLYPPCETDTWPGCRPLVEWLVRQLPPAAEPPEPPEWSERELADLRARFFASPYGRDLDHPEERSLLEDVTWFGSGWCGADPLRWSPVNVEILLTDWFPRKIHGEVALLAKLPDLLRAFIRFCHDDRNVTATNTRDTVASVDRWEPEFMRLIRTDRPQGAAALAARLLDAESGRADYDDDMSVGEIMLEALDRAVGGRTALLRLSEDPLPDDAFEWAGIPEDIREKVAEVLELCDRAADEILDVEHRTAMRRLLSRAAVSDPMIFRRKGKTERAAAAIAWIVCRANESAGGWAAPMEVQELLAWFGVSGPVSQRAEVFLRAIGVNPHNLYGSMDLGAPDLLVGERRRQIIERRDRWRAEG